MEAILDDMEAFALERAAGGAPPVRFVVVVAGGAPAPLAVVEDFGEPDEHLRTIRRLHRGRVVDQLRDQGIKYRI